MANYEVISWISPASGFETVLSNESWIDVSGWRGFDMVDVEHIEEETPFEYGSHYRRTKIPARPLELDVIVYGTDRQELFDHIGRLRSMFHYRFGIGKIKVVTPNENAVVINCKYQEGLQGKSGTRDDGVAWRKLTLVFRAFDPFFYNTNEVTLTYLIQENPPHWFPFPPFRLGGDAITAEFDVFIGGDVFSYPVWTIQGPGENPELTNNTTSKSLVLQNVVLGEGDTITIDTQQRIIQHSNGSNLFPNLKWGTGLWTLEPGGNAIQLVLPNANTTSRVKVTYTERYMGV